MNLPFQLPAPVGFSESPKWDGRNFIFADQQTPVLEYSENFAGWSDDLTALHEEAAGDSHPIDLSSRRDALTRVRECRPSAGALIMEIGCSSGFFIKELVGAFPDFVILGADVVKVPLYKLAREIPGLPLIRFDLLKCPLPDQSIDVLVMLNVLEHIEDDLAALKSAFKLLKPGGSLIIEVPAAPYLYDAYDAELHHFRRYSAVELRRKLTEAGFRIDRQSHLGFVLFPAFAVVKLLSKWKLGKKNKMVVRNQAASTSSSILVRWAMALEILLLSSVSLPFGIRTTAIARKMD